MNNYKLPSPNNYYLPGVMIQNEDDPRAWVCGSYETCMTLEDALKVIEKHKEHSTVLCAWVETAIEGCVWFKCYTNVLGQVNGKFIGKEHKK